MAFSKEKLRDLTGKMRGCSQEVEFLLERIDFESGPAGCTDRAVRAAKDLQDEMVRMEELRTEILSMTAEGIAIDEESE